MKNEDDIAAGSNPDELSQRFLKIKFKNKVKKLSSIPNKFAKLNQIIKKKYEEFKEGKKSYTLCYVDDEDELVNISDEEDYSVYKDFVNEKNLSTAKLYLTHKGQESKFEILNNRTICESHILDETSKYSQIGQSISMMESILPSSSIANSKAMDLLEEMQRQMRFLVEKEKQTDNLKNAKKQIKEAKIALKQQKKMEKEKEKSASKKKEKKEKSKEKAEKKPKEKGEKKQKNKEEKKQKNKEEKTKSKDKAKEIKVPESPQNNVDDAPQIVNIQIEEKKGEEQNVTEVKSDSKNNHNDLEKSCNTPIIVEFVEPIPNTDEKYESSIQPILHNNDNLIHKEDINIIKKEEVVNEYHGPICCNCKQKLDGEMLYLCSNCNDYILCEKCEADSTHKHCLIKAPANYEFKREDLAPFYNNLVSSYSDVIAKLFLLPRAIINENKDYQSPEASKLNQKMAKCLNVDKYKDGIKIKRGELVTLSWEVKNFTNNNWVENVVISCLPCSDIIISDVLSNISLKKGQKDELMIEFYSPENWIDKQDLSVYFALFNDDTQIGDLFKASLILTE